MKKRALALLLAATLLMGLIPAVYAAGTVAISAANFPDPEFRFYVTRNFDTNKDGQLSQAEIQAVKKINLCNTDCAEPYEGGTVSNLKGVEFFTALQVLDIDSNHVTSLDLSKNTALTSLNCGGNALTKLDLRKNTALTSLFCYGNQLTSLDLSNHPALKELLCDYNQLTSLNVNGCKALSRLECHYNQLPSLDLSGCPALKVLRCCENQLASLNVTGCKALEVLSCYANQLTTLNVAGCKALTKLECYDNQLTSLNASNCPALEELYCQNNRLSDLNVNATPKLETLYCQKNELYELHISDCSSLKVLSCSNNHLVHLDLENTASGLEVVCSGNTYGIQVGEDRVFDLSTIFGDFDLTQIKAWYGSTMDGSPITIPADTTDVTIYYLCDYGMHGLTLWLTDEGEWLPIDETTFPDPEFRNVVWRECDKNNDGYLSKEEIAQTTSLYATGMSVNSEHPITSLEGIEYLTELTELNCSDNAISHLDLSKNSKLKKLYCHGNPVVSIALSDNATSIEIACEDRVVELQADCHGNVDLTQMPQGFDLSKTSNWTGGSVSGTTLKVNRSGYTTVTYDYAASRNCIVRFSMDVVACPSGAFTDAPAPGNWAHESVDFAVSRGLFNGMSETTFAPSADMTRAMLVTVLWRIEGKPKAGTNKRPFDDVPDGKWYTEAVAWAADEGIVKGMGNGKFDPNGKITREQIATILHRFLGYRAPTLINEGILDQFPDASKVSRWASTGLAWAVNNGLVIGVGENGVAYLQPRGNATRAQVATILMRYIQKYGHGFPSVA